MELTLEFKGEVVFRIEIQWPVAKKEEKDDELRERAHAPASHYL